MLNKPHHFNSLRKQKSIHMQNLLNKTTSHLNKTQTKLINFNTFLNKIIATAPFNNLHPNQTVTSISKSTPLAIQKNISNCSFIRNKIPFTDSLPSCIRYRFITHPTTNDVHNNIKRKTQNKLPLPCKNNILTSINTSLFNFFLCILPFF